MRSALFRTLGMLLAAATVLRQLESCYDEGADDVATTLINAPDQKVNKAIMNSIMLDVRRMVARRHSDRQVLAARLEGSLQLLRNVTTQDGGIHLTDRALRAAVSVVATEKLTDLSVTPRDLRSILGLEEPDGVGLPEPRSAGQHGR